MAIICSSITVILVLAKIETVFSCFCFHLFVITKLRDRCYDFGVKARFQSQKLYT